MIRNSDGAAYKLTGSLQQFDPENPEFNLFNDVYENLIEISGSPIFYCELFIGKNTIDPLYREDRGKFWSNCPVKLYCLYEPITSQNYMNMFGMDGPDDMQFEFSYKAVLNTLGHLPKIGSRLYTPHKRENWEIISRASAEFRFWSEFKLILNCRRFQESASTGEGQVSQPQPDFKINSGNLF